MVNIIIKKERENKTERIRIKKMPEREKKTEKKHSFCLIGRFNWNSFFFVVTLMIRYFFSLNR